MLQKNKSGMSVTTSVDWTAVYDFLNAKFSFFERNINKWLKDNTQWRGACIAPREYVSASILISFYLDPDARRKRKHFQTRAGQRVKLNDDEMRIIGAFIAKLTKDQADIKITRILRELAPYELAYGVRVKDLGLYKR